MTSGKMTSFLLYPKHAEIMQAAAETCCEGNFSRFAQEAVLRLAAGLGVTTGELHLGDVPPLSLMADVRYLDRYLLALLQVIAFVQRHAQDPQACLPEDLRQRAMSVTNELSMRLASHPPETRRGPPKPVETKLLESLVENITTRPSNG